MIRPDKYENALWALNAVLVWIRKMTYEKAGYKLLGDVLEVVEVLPHVSLRQGDTTDSFRESLQRLATKDSRFNVVIEKFDGQ